MPACGAGKTPNLRSRRGGLTCTEILLAWLGANAPNPAAPMKRSRPANSQTLARQRALIRSLIEQTGLAGEAASRPGDDAPPASTTPAGQGTILRFTPASKTPVPRPTLAPVLPFPVRPSNGAPE